MNNYIANSKNRKFKKQIVTFLDRINFGAMKLPISGRIILIFVGILALSLFFPWFRFEYIDGHMSSYFAFSAYTGFIGYGILVCLFLIPFFLLSHAKKEKIRAHIPFRLSDTQAVVFLVSMIITALFHLFFVSLVFDQFALEIVLGQGFLIALSSSICILIAAFFLSKRTKEESVEMRYIDHQEIDPMAEYRSILGKSQGGKSDDEKNMSLPI